MTRTFAQALLGTLGLAASIAGCGSASLEPVTPTSSETVFIAEEPEHIVPQSEGSITRAELTPILDAGLGQFLTHVRVEPHMNGEDFVGHRITAMDDYLRRVDVRPGDTIVSVNAQPIGRPEEAFEVWNSLRVADALNVEVLRDGNPQQLAFAITD